MVIDVRFYSKFRFTAGMKFAVNDLNGPKSHPSPIMSLT